MDTLKEREPLALVLSQSIKMYEDVLKSLQDIYEVLDTASPSAMLERSELLTTLQRQAAAIDQVLFDRLSAHLEPTVAQQSLIETRQSLIQEIVILNKKISTKATRAKSLLGHELATLRNGMTAMSGYRQHQHHQGRILTGTS